MIIVFYVVMCCLLLTPPPPLSLSHVGSAVLVVRVTIAMLWCMCLVVPPCLPS